MGTRDALVFLGLISFLGACVASHEPVCIEGAEGDPTEACEYRFGRDRCEGADLFWRCTPSPRDCEVKTCRVDASSDSGFPTSCLGVWRCLAIR
jgi:hypothetical protein